MKLVHVLRLGGIAGAETYLLRMMPGLRARGVEVSLVGLETRGSQQLNAPFYRAMKQLGLDVETVNVEEWPNPLSVARLVHAIRRRSPHLVNSHLIHADVFTALASLFAVGGTRFVSTKHGYTHSVFERFGRACENLRPRYHWFKPAWARSDAYWLAAREAERRFTRSFAVSRALRDLLIKEGIAEPARIDVIHHGVGAGGTLEADSAIRYGSPQLLVVGRLISIKGHRFALEVARRLVPRYPGLKVVFAGAGPLESSLRNQARDLGIAQHVAFQGFRDDVRAQMRNSDILLAPSVSEGFGLVFVEAFEAGCPVVAFDVPAGNEIIDSERSGLLVPLGDIDAMTAAVARVLDSPPERERLVQGGRERWAARFTLEKTVDRTMDFYRRVLAE